MKYLHARQGVSDDGHVNLGTLGDRLNLRMENGGQIQVAPLAPLIR